MSDFVNKIKTKDSTEYAIHDERVDNVQAGTIVDALGLNADGELVKGSVSGGAKLYRHDIRLEGAIEGSYPITLDIILINNKNVAMSLSEIYNQLGSATYTQIVKLTQEGNNFIDFYYLTNAGYPGAPTELHKNRMASDFTITSSVSTNVTVTYDTVTEL